MVLAGASKAGMSLRLCGPPVGDHCAGEQDGHPGWGSDRHSGAVSASPVPGGQGTTCGNHRAHFPRHPRTSPAMVSAGRVDELTSLAWADPRPCFALQARGFVGSNPTAPTFFEYFGVSQRKVEVSETYRA